MTNAKTVQDNALFLMIQIFLNFYQLRYLSTMTPRSIVEVLTESCVIFFTFFKVSGQMGQIGRELQYCLNLSK